MTVATQLALMAHGMEYILCVEGIGWLATDGDLTDGLVGTCFATADIDGDLATQLAGSQTPTLKLGLEYPQGLSDTLDTFTSEYKFGTLNFSVIDLDDVLLGAIKPKYTAGVTDVLNANLGFSSTTVQIDNATNTFVEGDVITIASRESVKLGAKVLDSGTVYNYTSSVRGYAGTPRGRQDYRVTGLGEFSWESGTTITNYNPVWYDRRVLLLGHAPGETGLTLLYSGKLRGISTSDDGTTWHFNTVHDLLPHAVRRIPMPTDQNVYGVEWVPRYGGGAIDYNTDPADNVPYSERNSISTPQRFYQVIRIHPSWGESSALEPSEYYAPGYLYKYRSAAGGTEGVVTAIDANPTNPNSELSVTSSRHVVERYVLIDGQLAKLVLQGIGNDGLYNWDHFLASFFLPEYRREGLTQLLSGGSKIQYLIENLSENASRNRFVVNNVLVRHPIDVVLCILTTKPGEYWRGNTDSTSGGSSTVVDFSSTAPGWAADEWVGYALHAVAGNNKGEARIITDNDGDTITVDRAFTNAPGTSEEYQIRNTVYDVLPLLWGLGLNHTSIDVDSFEAVRDKYLNGVQVAPFLLDPGKTKDMWKLLQEQFLAPFNVVCVPDRATGKLKAQYLPPSAMGDGVIEPYVAVGASDIIELGDVEVSSSSPVESIMLSVRGAFNVMLDERLRTERYDLVESTNFAFFEGTTVDPSTDGKRVDVEIRNSELDSARIFSEMSTRKLNGGAVDSTNIEYILPSVASKLIQHSSPPHEVSMLLDMDFYTTVQAGTMLVVTDTTVHNPVNPFTGSRGWTSVACRVLGSALTPQGLRCRVELLDTRSGGLVAPAALVSAKGTDGTGDYFTVHADGAPDFNIDGTTNDWSLFAAGDLIELRDATGALKEAETILQTPASGKVYVTGTIASTIAAGDYITFATWVTATATANMRLYVAYGDSNNSISTADTAFEYA